MNDDDMAEVDTTEDDFDRMMAEATPVTLDQPRFRDAPYRITTRETTGTFAHTEVRRLTPPRRLVRSTTVETFVTQ